MNENSTASNIIDVSKLINSSTYLNNLLHLTQDMPDSPIDVPLGILVKLEKEQPDIYKALNQYEVLINIIGAVKLLSADIEDEINTLCETLLEKELL